MNDAYCRYCYARDKQGMKDAEVAKKSGIGKSTFSDWKSGRSMPKEEKMRKIAIAVGSTYDYISTGKEEQEQKKSEEDVKKSLLEAQKNMDELLNNLHDKIRNRQDVDNLCTIYLSLNEDNQKRMIEFSKILQQAEIALNQQQESDSPQTEK